MSPGMTKPRASAIVGLAVLLASSVCAIALDPSLDISQYAHTAWTVREGFAKGPIHSIAQTPDGYLWLGTEAGLLRFDGVRAVPWQPPVGEHLPSNIVKKLLVSRDGTLWIGAGRGLASWKDGKLSQYPEMVGWIVNALVEDDEGTVWAGGLGVPGHGRLCAIKGGPAQCSDPGEGVQSIYEDSKNALWVSTFKGLWRWKPQSPQFFPTGTTMTSTLTDDRDGGLLFGRSTGIQRFVKGKTEVYPVAMLARQSGVDSFLWDHDGSLWVGSFSGLVHLHRGRVELFMQVDGLSANLVHCVFEDREGNIWVATEGGLDRFRDFSVPTFSAKEGFPAGLSGPILAAKNGSLWVGTADRLINWRNSEVTVDDRTGPANNLVLKGVREIHDSGLRLQVQGLLQDSRGRLWVSTVGGFGYMNNDQFVLIKTVPGATKGSIAEGAGGDLWFSFDDALFHLVDGKNVERIPWDSLGVKEVGGRIAADPLQRGLWIGFSQGGIAYLGHGHIERLYTTADGLGEGRVSQFRADREGALWASTEGGLSHIKDGHVATLSTKNGLPCDAVHWSQEDADLSVWLYLECGLARVSASEMSAWIADPNRSVPVTLLDRSDGVATKSVLFGGFSAPVTESLDGKLWFSVEEGISVVDPHRLPFNKTPPPVHIEQIIADGKTYDVSNGLHLPARVRDVTINYTALSFVEPEKVRFRFKLEGQDEDWREVVNDREVQYSNLPPGHYRFRVTASNNSGVWSEEGTSLDFAIAPAYYQTNWFRALCVTTFLALLWSAYQVRVRQLRGQENKLRDVIETIPTIAWTAIPNGSVDFVNRQWEECTGLSTEKTLGSAWEAAVHPEDLKQHTEKWRAASASGDPFENEARFRRAADGAYRWFLIRAVPLRDTRGKIVKWYGTATDIEDGKRAEEAANKGRAQAVAEQQRFSDLVNSIEGIVWEADASTFVFSFVSQQAERILGYPVGQWLREPTFWKDHLHPEDRDWAVHFCIRATTEKRNHDFEYRFIAADGRVVWLRDLVTIVVENGRATRLRGVMFDVTQRKRNEEAVQEQANLLSLTHDAIFVYDTNGLITYWNRGAEELYGWTSKQVIGKVAHELLKTVFPAPLHEIEKELAHLGRWEGELTHTKESGTSAVVASRWSLQRDAEGTPLAILETNTDISERKRAEQAAHRSESELRALVENIPAMVFVALPGPANEFVSRGWREYTGLTAEETQELGWQGVVHPEDLARHMEKWRICSATGEPLEDETRFRGAADGQYRWFLVRAVPLRDGGGKILKWYGILTDIENRKRAEEALKRSEAYLAESQRLTKTGSWARKPDGPALYWSAETFRISGFDPEQGFPDRETVRRRIHPEDREKLRQILRKAYEQKADYTSAFRYVMPDGTVKHMEGTGHPVLNAAGEVVEYMGTMTDVTDRKRAEESLQRSEAYLAEAQRLSHTGSFAYDPGTATTLYWSEEIFRIFGLDPQQGIPDYDETRRLVHPDDIERVSQSCLEAFRDKAAFTQEYRVMLRDKTVKHLHVIWRPVLGEDGALSQYIGAAADVTDRKRAEEALRRSEAYLAEAQRLSHSGSWAYEAGGGRVYWSEENLRIWGFDPQRGAPDLETVEQRMHPEDRDREVEYAKNATRAGRDFVQEFRIVLPDGAVRHIHSFGHPVLSASGEVTEVLGTHIDITERKRAEQERERLRQLEAELVHMNRVVMLGELASSLAHEINQPITATVTSAKACLRWLAHDPPELERARAAARRIESDGNRAGEIIHRLRMFYKTGAPPQRELVDINDVVDEMLVLLRNDARRRSISLRTELTPHLPRIMADRVQLQQVLMNLMLNGMEAMGDRGGELIIRSQRGENGLLQISVSDTGVGLPSEKLDLIFNAFYTTKPQGTGMGLAISRSIIEAHGGRLWATNNAPRGATFHLTLPVEVQI
jgi:PAS domain S-box-containing protein